MPSQVPPGYTRGAIVLAAPTTSPQSEERFLQSFWDEAGGYGARLAVMTTPLTHEAASRHAAHFRSWEADTVTVLALTSRDDAGRPGYAEAVEYATGILLLGDDPLLLAGLLGGTELAQAIRRANARGKVVGAYGAGAGFLCQHILGFAGGEPRFAPGLGLLNRLALDTAPPDDPQRAGQRLCRAVLVNPFLVAVALPPDTGVAVFADTTLEVFGDQAVLLADGERMTSHIDPSGALVPDQGYSRFVHRLPAAYTFNFDDRHIGLPPESDIPAAGDRSAGAF